MESRRIGKDIKETQDCIDFEGPVPYWADRDEEFMSFFYGRDSKVRELMPETHQKVVNASKGILRAESYSYMRDNNFSVYVCPVRVKTDQGYDHPILLTYCTWANSSQMLYWPMHMIPLSNDERRQVWEDFVKDDKVYYYRKVWGSL